MDNGDEFELTFAHSLETAAHDFPRLGSALKRAQVCRTVRLRAFRTSRRYLQALEEIHAYTAVLEQYFNSTEKLSSLAFLVRRVRGDFVTALEALLSGFHKTVLDSMRDVMEIELLLRDFKKAESHIADWLSASEKRLKDYYQAGKVRERLGIPAEGAEAIDYKGHSRLLHVRPYENLILSATPGDPQDVRGTVVCLYDIFAHASRLFPAVDGLCDQLKLAHPHSEEFLKSLPTVREELQRHWERVAPLLGGSKSDEPDMKSESYS